MVIALEKWKFSVRMKKQKLKWKQNWKWTRCRQMMCDQLKWTAVDFTEKKMANTNVFLCFWTIPRSPFKLKSTKCVVFVWYRHKIIRSSSSSISTHFPSYFKLNRKWILFFFSIYSTIFNSIRKQCSFNVQKISFIIFNKKKWMVIIASSVAASQQWPKISEVKLCKHVSFHFIAFIKITIWYFAYKNHDVNLVCSHITIELVSWYTLGNGSICLPNVDIMQTFVFFSVLNFFSSHSQPNLDSFSMMIAQCPPKICRIKSRTTSSSYLKLRLYCQSPTSHCYFNNFNEFLAEETFFLFHSKWELFVASIYPKYSKLLRLLTKL